MSQHNSLSLVPDCYVSQVIEISSDESMDFGDSFFDNDITTKRVIDDKNAEGDYYYFDAEVFQSEIEDEPHVTHLSNILVKDCMLTGCDTYCKQTHTLNKVPWKHRSIMVNPKTHLLVGEKEKVADYSDHCYYMKPKEFEILKDIPTPPASPPESSSEDEVDDGTDEYCPPASVSPNTKAPPRFTRFGRKVKETQETVQLTDTPSSHKAAIKKRPYTKNVNKRRIQNSAEDKENNRILHNQIEQERRKSITTLFRNLKDIIPGLYNIKKNPSKLETLLGAVNLIEGFQMKKAHRESSDEIDVDTISDEDLPLTAQRWNTRGQRQLSSNMEDVVKPNKHVRNERRRRERLRAAYHSLQKLIPSLKNSPGASTRRVLSEAIKLIERKLKHYPNNRIYDV